MYGSEGWFLDETACRVINGANACMLSHVTGNTKRCEATTSSTTFNAIAWIRARRLRWVGHIMRMSTNSAGEPRQIKETLRVIFDHRQTGDILMDVDEDSWEALQKAADNRDAWRVRVRKIKDEARATTKAKKRQAAATATHQLQHQRFTFLPQQPSSTTAKRVTQTMVNTFFAPRKRQTKPPPPTALGWKPELAAYFKTRQKTVTATTTITTDDITTATNDTTAATTTTSTTTTTTTTSTTTPSKSMTVLGPLRQTTIPTTPPKHRQRHHHYRQNQQQQQQ